MDTDPALVEARERLRAEWGIDRRPEDLVRTLADGDWHDAADLIRDHAVSRAGLERVLAQLSPWLESERSRWRVRQADRERLLALWPACSPPPAGALASAMAALMVGLPPERTDLDHVGATPGTVAARARYLLRHFDLARARTLCLGDHDLTSLALAHVCPRAEIEAVDTDDRVLAYVGRVATERGWKVRPLFADLRLGLPRSVTGSCDLVFTDPPYTPAGVRLFLARAVAALRQPERGRIVFCYGFGERHPTLGLRVQSVLHQLRLVVEAILPAFNRYRGGQAVGSASALYVCRPTRFTPPAVGRLGEPDPRIYSRGPAALEAGAAALSESVAAAALEVAGQDAALAGSGWPRPAAPLLRPSTAASCALNLHPHFGSLYPRVLFALPARRAVLVVPRSALAAAAALNGLIGAGWKLSTLAAGDPTVVLAERRATPADAPGRCLAWLLSHPAATLGGAWREGLIAALAPEGLTVTKNRAREAIAATTIGARHRRSYLIELPLDALTAFPPQVADSLELVRT